MASGKKATAGIKRGGRLPETGLGHFRLASKKPREYKSYSARDTIRTLSEKTGGRGLQRPHARRQEPRPYPGRQDGKRRTERSFLTRTNLNPPMRIFKRKKQGSKNQRSKRHKERPCPLETGGGKPKGEGDQGRSRWKETDSMRFNPRGKLKRPSPERTAEISPQF